MTGRPLIGPLLDTDLLAEVDLRVADLRRATEIGIDSSRRLLHQASRLDGRPLADGPWMPRLLDTMVRSIAADLGSDGLST